jgi:serine-type D-Ala-D-Ala carboxypeptidase (penicillin-binding protein 5/6)
MTHARSARTPNRRTPRIVAAGLLAVIAVSVARGHGPASTVVRALSPPSDILRAAHRLGLGAGAGFEVPRSGWPRDGQAAFIVTGDPHIHAGPNQHPAPIASIAKVMTAYLVLRDNPLGSGDEGPAITLSESDVLDTERRADRHESVVPVAAGEQLTERQALEALLLPSANNIAAVLARWDAGSVAAFVARMNATARSLGMADTRYTDPSGYDDGTISTAADQVRIVARAMRLPTFAAIVATPSATLPVAGTVYTTDALLGHAGFVGVKTGSDSAAGGCFAFTAIRWFRGHRRAITGVVLGQPGEDRIAAGLRAAADMVDRITGRHTRRRRASMGQPPAGAPSS